MFFHEYGRICRAIFLGFGPVQGNIIKNGFIWWSGGIVIGAIILILMAKLFLIYKKSLDIISKKFIHDVLAGKQPPTVTPLEAYLPRIFAVLHWGRGKTPKDRAYLTDPDSVAEVIDAGLAVIAIKILPNKTFSYRTLPRIKAVFYGIIGIAVVVAIIGFWLTVHVMPGR